MPEEEWDQEVSNNQDPETHEEGNVKWLCPSCGQVLDPTEEEPYWSHRYDENKRIIGHEDSVLVDCPWCGRWMNTANAADFRVAKE